MFEITNIKPCIVCKWKNRWNKLFFLLSLSLFIFLQCLNCYSNCWFRQSQTPSHFTVCVTVCRMRGECDHLSNGDHLSKERNKYVYKLYAVVIAYSVYIQAHLNVRTHNRKRRQHIMKNSFFKCIYFISRNRNEKSKIVPYPHQSM